jgi:hypothetical protein
MSEDPAVELVKAVTRDRKRTMAEMGVAKWTPRFFLSYGFHCVA